MEIVLSQVVSRCRKAILVVWFVERVCLGCGEVKCQGVKEVMTL